MCDKLSYIFYYLNRLIVKGLFSYCIEKFWNDFHVCRRSIISLARRMSLVSIVLKDIFYFCSAFLQMSRKNISAFPYQVSIHTLSLQLVTLWIPVEQSWIQITSNDSHLLKFYQPFLHFLYFILTTKILLFRKIVSLTV